MTKENNKKTNFTKLTHSGISLIVLVITIIVILILAAAIIISLNNNNPIMEANKARYDSDVANMQAVFTNAVAKVMAHNKATVSVIAAQINTRISGVKETTGEVSYTVTDAINMNNSNGKIVFGKGNNTDTVFYTGKQLPIYSAGDTKWYVDSEGTISLEVAGVKYGNGEIVKPITGVLLDLYEDLAGDEEGATKGKLHIGDYVDYNPIATGVTEKTEDNGYVYVSQNNINGLDDAVASGDSNYSHLNTVTGQIFITQENLEWRVLGIDGNNILITTEDGVMPDNPLTVNSGTGFVMYGAKAYINGITEINNISKIYGNGELAKGATGMTIEHVNKIAGVIVTENSITPNEVQGTTNFDAYGSAYSFDTDSGAGWSPEAWINKADGDEAPGIEGKVSAYYYELFNENLKFAQSQIRTSLINKTGNSSYYLSSVAVNATTYKNYANFCLGCIKDNMATLTDSVFRSRGYMYENVNSIRPVVILKSNVIGELQTTDENGVSTWHIELE